ncbi:MAG: ABC transporter ATP-binding protein [Gemmatimonadetes bacterium]|nr:ABC transporter ATP-binding protein [Gemmatimonadota bacterium]MDA1103978.1 ABC transporter ATP-binding protein [Gemmatimonadota bacterium]
MSVVRWTLGFLRPYRRQTIAIVALSVAEIGLSALAPWPLKVIVDYVLSGLALPEALARITPSAVAGSAVALLVTVVVIGLVIQVASEVARAVHTQVQVSIAQRVVYTLRAELLEHLQALPLQHHVLTPTADSVYRLDADAHCVDDLIIGGVFPLAMAALNLSVMFVVLLYVDPTLALLSLAVAPFLFLCLRFYSHTMLERAEQMKALEATLIERAFEILSSVAAVKSFTRERHELARFSRSGDDTMRARLSLTWQESLFSVAVTAITLAGTALVLIVGGLHVLDGTLTLGSLLVVIAYLAAVYDPLSAIAYSTGSLQQAVASARRVRDIFAITPEILDDPAGIDASGITGRIRFEEVRFAYRDGRTVLDSVSFEAHPGELVALVGLTGAGKTTIADLIPRFYEPLAGRVLIDDVAVARYGLKSLREQIALVPQHPVIFTGTIADNIRYGRLDASDASVEAAARSAGIHDFVAKLPKGYGTPVHEGGATLSGGERQRIGIARALLKAAPILILDEPTSAIDPVSEGAIFDILRALRPSHTMLVIAHRLSTVRDATRILVLDGGRIVAQGSHDELIRTSDLYRQMSARLSVGRSLEDESPVDELLRATP